ncbi:MAG: aldo/keto reductase [Gammaproteobacteria bacterium]
MESRDFGTVGLSAPVLGFGAMQIGEADMDEAQAGRLLNQVLDLGIGLIDTARSYGLSETRIGRHLQSRRHEFLLSTKVGYGVEGCPDWTFECVRLGVDRALATLRTDCIDIVHLHSCPAQVLINNGVLEALAAAREAGKLRCVAYSGDNEDLAVALGSEQVQAVQTSINLLDQANLRSRVPAARGAGIAVLAKRTLAGAPWRSEDPPLAPPEAEYWRRYQTMSPWLPESQDMADMALRFAAFAAGVTCVLVGGTRIGHLQANVDSINAGPLDPETVRAIGDAWARCGSDWDSVI